MAKLPEYDRRVAPGSPGRFDSSTGGADFYSRLRASFSGLAAKVSGMADRAAASQGQLDGMISGIDPEFRPGRQNTIYGQAYDLAGTRAFLDARENQLREQMDALSIEFEADPAGLTERLAQLEQDTVKGLEDANFPEARVAFAGLFSRARTSYVREALRAKTEKDKAVFLATANETIDNRLKAVGRASYSGGLDEENQKVVAGEIEAVRRTVEAGVEAGIYTPEQARKIIDATEKEGVFGTIKGTFDRMPTIEEKRRYLDELRSDYGKGGDLTDVLSLEEFERLERTLEVGINQAESQRNGVLTGIDRAASSIESRATEGWTPPASEVAQLRATAAATGDPAAVARVEAAERFAELGRQLTTMSPLEVETLRRQTVLEMEKNGASERATEVLKAIDTVKGRMATALDSDPYAWGARSGAIKPAPALNLTGDQQSALTFRDRLAARDQMRQRYGRKVPFFTASEKESLAYIARNGGQAALSLASGMVEALGSEATDVLAEISDDAPVFTNMAGRLANGGSIAAAQDAMAALEARKNPDYKPVTITEANEQISARGALGGAYLADPRAETAVRQEARLIFEKRARDRGLTGDLSNDPEALELYEQALDEAAGGTMRNGKKYGGLDDVNGSRVVVPPDVPAGELEGALHRLRDVAGLPPIGAANGVPVTAGQLQGATLVTVGNGRYRAALGDPRTPDPRYVMTPEGGFWTVTIDELRKASPEPAPVDDESANARRRRTIEAWGNSLK